MTTTATSTATGTATSTTSATPSCVSVKPGKNGYLPPDACGNLLPYVPSLAAAVIFCLLFGAALIVHTVQAVVLRKRFCWVIMMGALWELLGYVFRALLTRHQNVVGYSVGNQLLVLLAPLWINAFIYMIVGRLLHFFFSPGTKTARTARLAGVSARRFGLLFVLLDIVAFIVQASGAVMLSGNDVSQHTIELGIHIYMGGIGLQQFFILCFVALTVTLHRKIRRAAAAAAAWRRYENNAGQEAFEDEVGMYLALVMISIRIIFRLIEYSRGTDASNPIPTHEAYQYVLDALPMFLSLVVMSIFHPGRVLKGPDSEFPKLSRREKRKIKAAKKAAKKAEKKRRDWDKLEDKEYSTSK
ncbi:putative RTA1 domain protein [Thermoascus aurantiacus ATCC 26904]